MKRPNLRIIGIEEGEEYQLKGIENIFNKITEENFPNLKKEMPMKEEEPYLDDTQRMLYRDVMLDKTHTAKSTLLSHVWDLRTTPLQEHYYWEQSLVIMVVLFGRYYNGNSTADFAGDDGDEDDDGGDREGKGGSIIYDKDEHSTGTVLLAT
ncbi:hypothetical protein STEG23_020280 [Scotinomys teguina]